MTTGFVIAGIVGLLIVVYFAMRRTGACPGCGKKIAFLPGVTCCPHCGVYGYSKAGQLCRVEKGYIANFAKFSVPLSQVKPPSEWRWPWAEACCLCSAPAASRKQVDVRLLTGAGGFGAVLNITRYRFEVGYCAQHKGGEAGIHFHELGSNEEHCLEFRSYDAWLMFKELNGIEVK